MHFTQNEIYHIYNRGNDKQRIFFNDGNYIFFLKKVREEWIKFGNILCYCLMPNHFHFMFRANEEACKAVLINGKTSDLQNFSKVIGKTLSSYTKAINNQNQTTGNLFQKKTKAKSISDHDHNDQFNKLEYMLTCFHYIHQNPLQAGLVKELKDWKYSSFLDYYGYRNGTLCNKNLAMELMNFSDLDFKDEVVELNKKIVERIF